MEKTPNSAFSPWVKPQAMNLNVSLTDSQQTNNRYMQGVGVSASASEETEQASHTHLFLVTAELRPLTQSQRSVCH